MRVKMHKWFWAWSFDKEEQWLNDMSAKGLHLVSVSLGTYLFEEGAPGEYTIRLEMLDNWPGHPESRRYIGFVEDSGAEYLDSILCWAYFRKKTCEGGFDLFSDIDSRIRHLDRLLLLIGVLAGCDLFYAGWNFFAWFLTRPFSGNLTIAIVCGAAGALLTYGFTRLAIKRRRLKQSRILHE